MIEITAKLIKGHIYLIGEIVECSVTFLHPPSPSHKISQSHDDVFESLAWASAQINCQCTTNLKLNSEDNIKKVPTFNINDTALPLSVHDSGQLELSTKPKILFCDLRLLPGQSKTYIFKEKIPSDSPPSYRGQLVKYSYKLIIGTQRVNAPIKLLKIPLRILPITTQALNEASGLCNDTTEDLSPANPFLEVRQQDTPFEVALRTLQNITARRKPNFYMISNTWGKVARFCLFKPAYKLGEDIIGTLDFSVATVTCVQLAVSLQCEEETNIQQNDQTVKQLRIGTFNNQHEVCLGLKYTQLVLPIPLHVTPGFTTPLMSLRWRLHFEFVTSTNKSLQNPTLDQNEWQAPADLSVETMVWSLPIQIFSTTPVHVIQGLQTNNVHRLLIR
uniref:RAB6A-GEF complex partner protein 2 n=1 Tax=Photinus pyralis TaxID=7054 RepID=A0A1Y1MV04_PHOPY